MEEWKRVHLLEVIRSEINEEILERIKERARSIFENTDIEYKLDLDSKVFRTSKINVYTEYYVYVCVQDKDIEMANYYIEIFLKEEKVYLEQFAKENEALNVDNIEDENL